MFFDISYQKLNQHWDAHWQVMEIPEHLAGDVGKVIELTNSFLVTVEEENISKAFAEGHKLIMEKINVSI